MCGGHQQRVKLLLVPERQNLRQDLLNVQVFSPIVNFVEGCFFRDLVKVTMAV
jgi:hypothetical protein